MSNFCLKKLSIYGQDKTPSYIDFESGLNIIHGVSDTGKTCIVKCIDFVFGSSNKYPIPETHGYEVVNLLIETANGNITLERIIGKTKIKLTSNDVDFISGEYPKTELGDVLLPLIGIKNHPSIIKNSRYDKQRLTLRSFIHSFIINEEEIIQTQPILISKESIMKTSSISALLYLISAINFDNIDSQEDKKIKEARKHAVEKYINNEILSLNDKKSNLDKLLASCDKEDVETTIQKLTGELSIIEKSITDEINKQNNLLSKIFNKQDIITEYDIRLSRYSELRSQYIGDIERLGFIVDGENNISKIPLPDKCPYCDNEISHKNHSYIETANAELKRILDLLNGLSKTETSTQRDKDIIKNELNTLYNEKMKIDNYVKSALKPKQQNIQKMLSDYRAIITLQNEIELINKMKTEKSLELTDLMSQSDKNSSQYKPKEHFPANFEKDFTRIFTEILIDCKYENLSSSLFSLETFDAIVNAKHKDNFGKGFRAFINMVIALTMRKYLNDNGKYTPKLLVVDSPLLSLEQGVDEAAPESMKAALMTYLMTHQEDGQTIIVENNIPNLNYKQNNVHLIQFTGGKSDGRYGLLEDVKI